tara:strand:- start:51 stop:719 length:669 start_codon:yes stop_codon:yes gene_type:complete
MRCFLEDNAKKQVENRKTTEQFIRESREVHGDKFLYENTNYETAFIKVCITCPEHGHFYASPSNHIRGSGCPVCGQKKNISEANTRIALEQILKITLPSKWPEWLRNPETGRRLQLDGYDKNHGIAFEFNGKQHYEAQDYFGGQKFFNRQACRDKIKNSLCEENGVVLIVIDGRKIPHYRRKTVERIKPYIVDQMKELSHEVKQEILKKIENSSCNLESNLI